MEEKKIQRRSFLKNTGLATAGLAISLPARSYSNVLGANDKINVAVIGCYRRFPGLADPLSGFNDVQIKYVSDVDSRRQLKGQERIQKNAGYTPTGEKDFRKILDDKTVDAIFLAIPDHWHAPGTWMALDAGKHVYVEKPCSHNPREGELLIELQKKYGKVVQMGNQQRSAPGSRELIMEIHNGLIGTTYHALAFYSNGRGRVPNVKSNRVPEYLDWELWQGPAPRKEFKDILGDYMWHWFWHWGTGETGNNATHELDVARWALQVNYPQKVVVNSAKNHFKNDPWTMYDTMFTTFEFENGKTISWDGKSRNNYKTYGTGRGTIIYGSEGTAFVDRSGYKVYGRNGKLKKSRKENFSEGGTNLGGGGGMTALHVRNFLNAFKLSEKQNSNIEDGAISTHLCHYANISSRLENQTLEINPETGHFRDKAVMDTFWSRSYEPGWEPPPID